MIGNRHPYTELPWQAFWKTAVAEVDPRKINLAWAPKSALSRHSEIVTAGSCFAQHISKSLKEHGFNWLDSEPAPVGLPRADHARNGYGVFSFRTGNIYTAALLKQWIFWAMGRAEQSSEYILNEGRYYDPFRPSLTEEGFASADEVLAARQITLAAMLDAVTKADLFIFTLGLTEAWLNKDGTVYPMCPGTIRGTFSAARHVFHNYSEQEVERDLTETFDDLRRINPNLRFLLTVSPVPLTATASGQHILTATTYSKSVLRSVAGHLSQTRDDVDYFPSYELITAPPFKGQFFEKNMRAVSAEGVAFVMKQFLGAVGNAELNAPDKMPGVARPVAANDTAEVESDTDICDDIILETWSNKPAADSAKTPNILLIGDSHMGMIAKVFDEQGIPYAGGAIMNASDWHKSRFGLDEEKLFTPHSSEQKRRWEEIYGSSVAKGALYAEKPWLITNIGQHRGEAVVNGMNSYLTDIYGEIPVDIRISDLHSYLLLARRVHLALLCRLLKEGYRVIVVSDPPVEPREFEVVFSLVDSFLFDIYTSIGCSVFSARNWIEELGGMPDHFRSPEVHPVTKVPECIHGSVEYYRQLTKAVFAHFALEP